MIASSLARASWLGKLGPLVVAGYAFGSRFAVVLRGAGLMLISGGKHRLAGFNLP